MSRICVTARLASRDVPSLPVDNKSEHMTRLVNRFVANYKIAEKDVPTAADFAHVGRANEAYKCNFSLSARTVAMIDLFRGDLSRADFCVWLHRREGNPLHRAARRVEGGDSATGSARRTANVAGGARANPDPSERRLHAGEPACSRSGPKRCAEGPASGPSAARGTGTAARSLPAGAPGHDPQDDDAADEAEMDRLCAVHDARYAPKTIAQAAAPRSSPAPMYGSPVLWSLDAPAAQMPTAPASPLSIRSHAPAPAIAPVLVVNRVSPVAVSVNKPTSKKVHVMSTSENAHEAAENGNLPPNTAGTPRTAARGELDNLRKTMAEQGVENMRPVSLAYSVFDEDAEQEVKDAVRELRVGGTLRVILGLSTSPGIPVYPMDQDTAHANVNACTTLVDDTGIRNHVNTTVFAVLMSETGNRLDGYGVEQAADDIDDEDADSDDDVDLDDDADDAAAAAGDAEEEESGLIVVLNFQRKA